MNMLSMKKKAIVIQKYIDQEQAYKGFASRTKIERYSNVDDYNDVLQWLVKNKYVKFLSGNLYENKTICEIYEEDYYDYLKIKIFELLGDQHKKGDVFDVEITARKDSKIVGRWTRPDIVAYSKKSFAYVPDFEFDIITYEVKRPQDLNVLALFEALAHRSAATKSYVVCEEPQRDAHLERIFEEAHNHGIGIIFIEPEVVEPRIAIKLEAVRRPLNKAKASDFLQAVMTNEQLATLSKIK